MTTKASRRYRLPGRPLWKQDGLQHLGAAGDASELSCPSSVPPRGVSFQLAALQMISCDVFFTWFSVMLDLLILKLEAYATGSFGFRMTQLPRSSR